METKTIKKKELNKYLNMLSLNMFNKEYNNLNKDNLKTLAKKLNVKVLKC